MFSVTETCDDFFMVHFDDELIRNQKGSYNVMGARVLGLSYPDYLRFCRDEYNAVLRGNAGYSYAVFKEEIDVKEVVKILNKQYNEIRKKLLELDFFKNL